MAVIRLASINDSVAIADLIRRASEASFLTELPLSAKVRFISDHTIDAMSARLQSAEFEYHIAEEGGVLAGLIGVRNGTHLFSLYVEPGMQGRGIARMLWDHVKGNCPNKSGTAFTVNSSRNAVAVYEHLGFTRTGSTVDANGIQHVPMRFEVA